jgi:putative ABC transport system permease protein
MRNSAAIAWSVARRELRGGLKGFKVFLACLVIGVGAMAAVGSIMESINHGLARDARALLGGDIEITQNQKPLGPDVLEFLSQLGDVAETVELRAMSAVGDQAALVELKGVSEEYPLFGEVILSPEKSLLAALQAGGVVVDQSLLNQMNVGVGDAITIGKENFVIRAVLEHEPDTSGPFLLGPRVILDNDQLQATGLIGSATLVKYRYLLRFNAPMEVAQFKTMLAAQFPKSKWRVRDYTEASVSIRRFLDNLSMFLTLTALTALLCGGIEEEARDHCHFKDHGRLGAGDFPGLSDPDIGDLADRRDHGRDAGGRGADDRP